MNAVETADVTAGVGRLPAAADLGRALRDARSQVDRLQGESDILSKREAGLAKDVGEAKWRIEQKPAMDAFNKRLQTRLHSRTVGIYQDSLTALVHDVLPEPVDIHLDLGTFRDQAALTIAVDRNGNIEDILDGNGGALTNIVGAGLRFMAMVKSQNRRFIALDEAECWVSEDRVPYFVAVIEQLASQIGIQTLMISHWPRQFFEKHAYIVGLEGTPENGVSFKSLSGKPDWRRKDDGDAVGHTLWRGGKAVKIDQDFEVGLRYIRLRDFRTYKDATLQLSPHMTVLTGPINHGKSHVIGALRAVSGDSTDRMIRHGQPHATIDIGLEGGMELTWVRRRNGSPKCTWALKDENGETIVEASGEPPEWLKDTLGIAEIQGLDVQLARQKKPVFLLDEKPAKQAAILAVGSEAGRVSEYLAAYKRLTEADRETVRNGEAEIAGIRQRLVRLKGLSGLRDDLAVLEGRLAEAAALEIREERLQGLLDELARRASAADGATRRAAAYDLLPADLDDLPEVGALAGVMGRLVALARQRMAAAAALEAFDDLPGVLRDLPDAAGIAGVLRRLQAAAAVVQRHEAMSTVFAGLDEDPQALPDVGRLLDILGRMRRIVATGKLVKRQIAAFADLGDSTVDLPDHDALRQMVASLERRQEAMRDAAAADARAADDIAAAEAALAALEGRMGHRCPTCGGEIKGEHAHG